MINAILIDDEVHCLDTLSILLGDYCPEVQIMEKCISGKTGLEAVETFKPALVFLDIEMPVMNGFDFLEQYPQIPFSVIFTTSYDQYAIKALRFSALDYLLKPIDPKEMISAVHKIRTLNRPPSPEQVGMLMDQIKHNKKGFTKIAVPTAEGFEMIPADQLVRCEAENNYTHLFLKNKKKITACRTLKDLEEQLQGFEHFIRVHHSHMINLNEVEKYVRGEGGYLVMCDGTSVSVSRSRKDTLMKYF